MAKLLLVALLAILPLPMVHGQGTPLLFLGPGQYSDEGKSEVFSLPVQGGNLSIASCTVPDYPVPATKGYVAFVKDGYLQLCGGRTYSSGYQYQSSCYVLRDSGWVATTPLMSAREGAAAITFHNGSVLISGGHRAYRTGTLSSSEILTGTTWAPALKLPLYCCYEHCMLGLNTGEIFLHDGRATYLSTNLTRWQTMTSSGIVRGYYSCAVVTLGTEQEVWVGERGSSGTTEIYSVATDTWSTGPSLPGNNDYHGREFRYQGEFVSYNDQLYYADGWYSRYIYRLKAGWTQDDAWEKIGWIYGKRTGYQAMIISQDICEGLGDMTIGKKIKRTPLNVTFTPDGSVGYVSGSLASVVTNLASASTEPLDVSCCAGGNITTTTCGNGISCTNICGEDSSGCLTLKLEKSALEDQVCGASMDQHGWCSNSNTIKGLTTSECRRKKRQTDPTTEPASTASTACTVCTTTIADLWYCPFKVLSIGSLKNYTLCCMHPDTREIPDVPKTCCNDYGACF